MAKLRNALGVKANAIHVWLYRRSRGRRFNKVKGMPVALLTVAGRRTGVPHTTPVVYLEVEGTWVVAGSAGGAKPEPQWFRNLRATDRATIEIGGTRNAVAVHVAQGEQRDQLWARLLDKGDFWQKYADESGRVIPLATLSPT